MGCSDTQRLGGYAMNTESDSQRQILLTGATGFIGVPLCEALLERGHRLTVLTRNPRKAKRLLGENVTLVTRLDELPDMMFQAVINLAGEPLVGRWNDRRKEEIRRSRIGLTEALLEHFHEREHFPETLINGSAVGYYGDGGERPLTEIDGNGQGFGAELCRDWEAVAERFGDQGARVCRLRTGIVLGNGGGALQAMLLPFKLGLGGRLGRGRQWMSWIHREDMVSLILFCLDNREISGPVNATAPNPVTNRYFTRTLAKALHRPAIFHTPAPVLRLVMGEMADELLLVSQRVLPEVAVTAGFQFQHPELPMALQDILRKK